jgi:hypothetical protein
MKDEFNPFGMKIFLKMKGSWGALADHGVEFFQFIIE